MKSVARLLCIAFCPLFLLSASAQTAASALSVIEKEKGAQFLSSLVEVTGERGEPQPPAWTFRFNDPGARGGIREIVVQNGQILSERTPIRALGGTGDLPTLPAHQIQFDTRNVFLVANQAAIREGLAFHWLDYALRPDLITYQPVWYLTYIDVFGVRVGEIALDAKSLREVTPLKLTPDATAGRIEPETDRPQIAETLSDAWSDTSDFFSKSGRKVYHSILNGVGTVEQWLTGDRTVWPPQEE